MQRTELENTNFGKCYHRNLQYRLLIKTWYPKGENGVKVKLQPKPLFSFARKDCNVFSPHFL